LVISGVYRISRNPMYLGMLLFLCAWALYIGNPLSGVGAVLFGVVMNVFQIAPEEKVLSEKFGKAYLDYCSKVRRWI
jgi:protein-S-isoprenylcysteine O-methyltransferase Ste14